MASARVENPNYKYEIIKRIWIRYLRQNNSRRIGETYFDGFIAAHPGFQFSMVKIYDGTTKVMVDAQQYQMMRNELREAYPTAVLPDIDPFDLNRSETEVLGRRSFSTQAQFDRFFSETNRENNLVHERIFQNAVEHCENLRGMLTTNKTATFLSFDLEVYDRDYTTILEIGYVKFTLYDGDQPEYFHAIVNDDLLNREGFDNRDNFQYGTSLRMTLNEAAEKLQREIAGADALVTQSGHNDENYLADNNIQIADKPMFDTQKLALELLPKTPGKCFWGLSKMLEEMGIYCDLTALHNAGNDVHYTMEAFKALVERAMPTTRF